MLVIISGDKTELMAYGHRRVWPPPKPSSYSVKVLEISLAVPLFLFCVRVHVQRSLVFSVSFALWLCAVGAESR